MGFELTLRGIHRGTTRAVRNPFTGEPGAYEPLVMTDEERRTALGVLARYSVTLREGGSGTVRVAGAALDFCGFDETGCLVKIGGDLEVACRVLFELASAGTMAILPDQGDGLVTTNEALALAKPLEGELGSPIVLVDSPEALAAALAAECASARAYTERATRG